MVSTAGGGGGPNGCHTGRVEVELYNKGEYWMNLASIDLDTGSPSSRSRIIKYKMIPAAFS